MDAPYAQGRELTWFIRGRSEDLKARMDEACHAAVAALRSASLEGPASS